jgi:predicted nucleic acid-binding protein
MDTAANSALCALRAKYRTMRTLRIQASTEPELDTRARLSLLAAEFPGALRELDQLPMEWIEGRLRAIEQTIEHDLEPERWMRLQVAYHGFMRAVLRIRRLSLGRPRSITDVAHELAALPYEPAADEPPVVRFAAKDLDAIRRPPGGRLNPWVFAQVAKDHGVTAEVVEKALFIR